MRSHRYHIAGTDHSTFAVRHENVIEERHARIKASIKN